ncbi:MAG: putative porin [Muribaculaceae bacterium]|nr:putative porin [Muribaculaceae bacterium]
MKRIERLSYPTSHGIMGSAVRACCLIFLFSFSIITAFAQGDRDWNPKSMPGEGEPFETVKEPSAWTLTYPLGFHIPAPVDTAQYNYQRRSIPTMASDAWATTGNLGSPGTNLLWFEKEKPSGFLFYDALGFWMPSFAKQKFHNTYIPTTILQYNYCGSSENHQDRLQADFAGNVNRRIGIGGFIDYLHSKGCYNYQAAKNFNFGLSCYYFGDRYELQTFYQQYAHQNLENGGITDDRYITDPAAVQGGVTSVQSKSIPTQLTSAKNILNGAEFYMNHAYKIGYWSEEQVNDTLTRDIYIPVMKILYSFDYRHYRHEFNEKSVSNSFWSSTYFDKNQTYDNSKLNTFSNTIGIYLIEGFKKWMKFGLSAYATYQLNQFTLPNAGYEIPSDGDNTDGDNTGNENQPSDNKPEEANSLPAFIPAPKHNQNFLFVGGRIEKAQGSILRYNADVRFGLSGDAAGDLDLNGQILTNIPLFGDTVSIEAHGGFHNNTPDWLTKNYVSNHFIWSKDFGKTRSVKFGGSLEIPWTRTRAMIDVENIQNRIYFGNDFLPYQHGGNVQIMSVGLQQDFKVGILNWNNRVTWQVSSDQNIVPLPQLSIYSNLFIQARLFKVLHVQAGVDCDFYTKYKGLTYQPATMTFCNQQETSLGGYPFCNAYVNLRLYRCRFYVMMSHVNQGLFGSVYNEFSLPHYPINPRRFQIGIAVDFAN